MIENLPTYIAITFVLTTIATLLLFYWAIKNSAAERISNQSNIILACLVAWLMLQSVLTLKNLYKSEPAVFPPKLLLLGILPPMLLIISLFITKKGRLFIDNLPLKNLTYINIVRLPVEIVLFWLCVQKAVPQLMTFEGRNFDIASGITAPFIAYFGFTKRKLNRKIILTWNFICLALLANIVLNALLSAPFLFQRFAFEQPNIAILNFPFSWLPTFIVPVILFTHLASIRQLSKSPRI